MKDSHLAFYLWWMVFSWKNPICNTVDNYFQKNGFPLAFSLFSLKIFTPQTSKHYSLNTFVFDKCFHQKNKERRVWYQLLLSLNFRLTLLFTEAFASFRATFCRSCSLFQNRTKYWIINPFEIARYWYERKLLRKISSTVFEKNCSFGTKDLNNLD